MTVVESIFFWIGVASVVSFIFVGFVAWRELSSSKETKKYFAEEDIYD